MTENESHPFMNPALPVESRVQDLLGRLTIEEKCGQMLHEAPAIERLGIPSYNWWNECLHGVARAGVATVFPQAIGLAAIFDAEFMLRVATVISDEARAKHHEFLREGDTNYYGGLTFWTPNINIFRDPRWGRGHETYGECPHLTGRLGVAFCKGLQGDDETYLKLVATPKHYVVHSGPEGDRHSFNAKVSEKDFRETYLPAFRDCVVEANAQSVMGAYNRTNGEVCCGSKRYLTGVLREELGFSGYVVSDCWALRDFHEHHKITKSEAHSAAHAVKNGCDLNCGCVYEKLLDAIEQGLLSEADIDVALGRLVKARIQLGMFDPPERVPYAQIPYEINDCDEHRALTLDAARKSIVLLKNDDVLPLSPDMGSIAVIGPNADDRAALLGNYHGHPSRSVTPLEGIRAAVSENTRIWYCEGCKPFGTSTDSCSLDGRISEAVGMARRAEAVVIVLGLNSQLEGEQGDTGNADASGDKLSLDLPGLQQPLLEAVVATGTPVVTVLLSGSALGVTWAHENTAAVIQGWYPGAEGGRALADILFGKIAPSGRLPLTFYKSIDDCPDFRDYAMENRTYRFFKGEPLYPFGYGLGYGDFEYSDLKLGSTELTAEGLRDDGLTLEVTLTNTWNAAADEVIQVYVRDIEASTRVANYELRSFGRATLDAGESKVVSRTLTPRDLSLINDEGRRVLEPGEFEIHVGGSQPDSRSVELTGRAPLSAVLTVTGQALELAY